MSVANEVQVIAQKIRHQSLRRAQREAPSARRGRGRGERNSGCGAGRREPLQRDTLILILLMLVLLISSSGKGLLCPQRRIQLTVDPPPSLILKKRTLHNLHNQRAQPILPRLGSLKDPLHLR